MCSACGGQPDRSEPPPATIEATAGARTAVQSLPGTAVVPELFHISFAGVPTVEAQAAVPNLAADGPPLAANRQVILDGWATAERWRELVSKYFRPGDMGKALWVIHWESGGDPNAVGDNGCSVGLFQLSCGGLGLGMTVEARMDPATNIAVAAAAVYGGSGWGPWGEGRLHQGRPFGALGRHPYPGD